MEYYLDKSRGGGVKEWKNEFSVISWGTWLDFDPITYAEQVTTPYLVFHSDFCALPGNTKKRYSQLKGEKEMVGATPFILTFTITTSRSVKW
jgi:hypothetical protein